MSAVAWILLEPSPESAAALSHGVDYVRVVLSLMLCLALGVGLAFLARRTQRFRIASVPRQLTLLESTRLDTRTSLHVVRYGQQHALIATAAGAVTITLVDAPAAATPATSERGS